MNINQVHFARLFEHSVDILCVAGDDGLFKIVSPAFYRLLGYSEEEVQGQPFLDFIHPEDRRTTRQEATRLLSGATTFHFENRYRHKDGTYRWFAWTAEAVGNTMYGVGRDVTAQKNLEAQVQASHALLQAISDIQAVFIADAQSPTFCARALEHFQKLSDSSYGFIGAVSHAFEAPNHGVNVHTIGGTHLGTGESIGSAKNRVTQTDLMWGPAELAPFDRVLETGKPIIANRLSLADQAVDSPHPPLRSVLAMPLYKGAQLIGLVGLANPGGDYSDSVIAYLHPLLTTCANLMVAQAREKRRKTAEQALKRAEEKAQRLALVASRTTNGVVITDTQGQIDWVNEGFTRMTGYALEDVMGKSPGMVLQGPASSSAERERMRARIAAHKGFSAEMLNYRKSGEPYWVHIEAQPLHDEAGTFVGFMGIETEITERKQTELALRASQQGYKALYTCIPIPAFTWQHKDDGFYLQMVNAAANNITAGKAQTFEGQEAVMLFDGRPDIISDLTHCYTQQKTIRRETTYRTPVSRQKEYVIFTYAFVAPDRVLMLAEVVTNKCKSAEAIRASEERYRLLSEHTHDLICMHDPEGHYLYVSPSCRTLLGYDEGELLGKSPYRFFHPDDRDRIRQESHNAMLKGRKLDRIEYRMERRNGRYIWLETYTKPVLDDRGHVVHLVTASRDITERRRIAHSLAESQQFLETLLTHLPVSVFAKKASDGTFVFWNKASEELHGLTRAQVTGKTDHDFFLEEQADFFRKKDQEVLASGEPLDIPVEPVDSRQLGKRLLHTRKVPIYDIDKQPLYLLGISVDITEQQKMEEALRESLARLNSLATNVPGVIYRFVLQTDRTPLFSYISERCIDFFGLDAATILADPYSVLERIYPEDRDALIPSIRSSADMLKAWRWEGRVVVQERVRWLVGVSQPQRRTDGSIVWDGLFLDITQRKEAETALRAAKEEAEKMNRLKTAFLNNISHEFRTPLTAILGFGAILEDELEDEHKEFLGLIRASGERLLDTLNGVLDLALLEAEEVVLRPQAVDVKAHVRRLVERSRIHAEAKGLQLEVAVSSGVQAVVDPLAFERIVQHVLNNAIKFTEEGKVDVRVQMSGTQAVVEIEDTGIGIAPTFLEEAFLPFTQEHAGNDRPYEGSGLGLAITKHLVELLGGRFEVESTPKQGTTFRLFFPGGANGGLPTAA